ncbi:MAG TPA: VWA domain-containing protein [Longimicrobiales bacterium]|nr:VWA domain-containing protein [Longimicrobiales bacterium]
MSPGALVENLMRFVRLLRSAGLRCGAGASIETLRAVEAVGMTRRDDFFWALHAVLVTRHEEHEVFRRAFDLFWREPSREPPDLAGLLPASLPAPRPAPRKPGRRRVEAALGGTPARARPRSPGGTVEERVYSWSDQEVLRTRDFEQMSVEEVARANRAVEALAPALPRYVTRRVRPDPRGGRVDLRRTLRASLRSGHGTIPLQRSRRGTRSLDVVLLCDISGSMERYSRVILHFAHALTGASERVHTFLFGTRVTNVTRQLRHSDVDAALQAVGRQAPDWSGGTRIGASLAAFNRVWSRRVLGRGAVVLLVTDGLDREGARGIVKEAARLRRSCRRLVWLNPLLRFEGFEPRAAGVRALLGQVDEMRPVHNLESLEQLVAALAEW